MAATTAVIRERTSRPRMSTAKLVAAWTGVTLLAFPIGGYIGWGIGGHVDGTGSALINGAITGAAIGLAQWLFLRRDLRIGRMWIAGTSAALAIGTLPASIREEERR
jgi:hypothetical protein